MTTLVLGIDASGARRGAQQFERSADKVQRDARGATRSVNRMEGSFSRLGNAAKALGGVLAAAGIGVALTQMIRQFAEFERQLVEVGKTTDLEGEKLQELGGRLHQIAAEVPLATSRLQSLSVAAGQLGVTGVDNVAKFTEVLGKMETATDIAGEQGARSLARLLNITGESISDVDRLGSSIVALGNNLATTEQEIVQTSTFLGAATQQFDLTARQVVGLSGHLRAMGQRAETSGSAVGAAMTEINSALARGGENAQALSNLLGESADTIQREFGQNSVSVLVDFAEALSNLPAAQQSKVLDRFNLAGRETRRVINALAADTDGLNAALGMANEEWDRNEALNKEAARAAETLSAEWQFLQNQFTETSAQVGEELAPALTEIIRQLRDVLGDPQVVEGITNIGHAFVGVAGFIADAVDAVTRFGKAIGENIARMQGYAGGLEDMQNRVETINENLDRLTQAPDQFRNDARIQQLREERKELQSMIETIKEFDSTSNNVSISRGDMMNEVNAQLSFLNRDVSSGGGGGTSTSVGSSGDGNFGFVERQRNAFEIGMSNMPATAGGEHGFVENQMNAIEMGLEGIQRKAEETGNEMSEFAISASRNMQSAFADFLFDPMEKGFDGLVESFANTIRRMIAEAAAAKILDSGSEGGGWLGKFFGAMLEGRATGGPVQSGESYIVGEKGPEVLTMGQQSGHVTPNNKMGGGNTYVNVINEGGGPEPQVNRRRSGKDEIVDVVMPAVNAGGHAGQLDSLMRNRYGITPGTRGR